MLTDVVPVGGPGLGLSWPSSAPGSERTRTMSRFPQPSSFENYYPDARIPTVGTRFDLAGPGGKRPRLTGNFASAIPDDGQPNPKRPRYSNAIDFMGGESAWPSTVSHQDAFSRVAGRLPYQNEFGFRSPYQEIATIGFFSNPTIPQNEVILRTIPNYETPGENDFVIMEHHNVNRAQRMEKTAQGMLMDRTPRTGYTVPGFNHWLASVSRKHTDMAAFYAPREPGQFVPDGEWQTAEEVWRRFTGGGVVDSEIFLGGTSSVSRHMVALDRTNLRRNQSVNMVKAGRVSALRLWTTGLYAGTRLWFIIKRVPRPRSYRVDATRPLMASDLGFMQLESATVNSDVQLSDRPFQLIPFASNERQSPSDEDLAYEDEFGIRKYGLPIMVGIVNKEDYNQLVVDVDALAVNLDYVRQSGLLDINLSL